MIDETLEKNYVIGKLRHDLAELMESWAERSASYRNAADAALDQPYGDDPREKIDIFHCGAEDAPLLITYTVATGNAVTNRFIAL